MVHSLTSLGAIGMQDKLIEEGLKQPDWIKVSFKKGSKDITGHITPDQAWLGPKHFFTFTLPDFMLKILTWLSEAKKEDGPTLFNLLGQFCQDVGLTKWTNVVGKQSPKDTHLTKENFNECIRAYLKAVAGFPNIDDQLIHWLCVARKPTFMPMHEFMWHQVQLFSYLDGSYFHQMMELPTAHSAREKWTNLSCPAQGTSV
jgi:hypothetical protein